MIALHYYPAADFSNEDHQHYNGPRCWLYPFVFSSCSLANALCEVILVCIVRKLVSVVYERKLKEGCVHLREQSMI
jgi:hypothetical protein